MIIGTYLFVAFIVFFFMWKKYALPEIKEKSHYDAWFEILGFHKAVWGSIFWIVAMPMLFIWKILEKLTNNKNN